MKQSNSAAIKRAVKNHLKIQNKGLSIGDFVEIENTAGQSVRGAVVTVIPFVLRTVQGKDIQPGLRQEPAHVPKEETPAVCESCGLPLGAFCKHCESMLVYLWNAALKSKSVDDIARELLESEKALWKALADK